MFFAKLNGHFQPFDCRGVKKLVIALSEWMQSNGIQSVPIWKNLMSMNEFASRMKTVMIVLSEFSTPHQNIWTFFFSIQSYTECHKKVSGKFEMSENIYNLRSHYFLALDGSTLTTTNHSSCKKRRIGKFHTESGSVFFGFVTCP